MMMSLRRHPHQGQRFDPRTPSQHVQRIVRARSVFVNVRTLEAEATRLLPSPNLIERLKNIGAYKDIVPSGEPNLVLVNEYLPGQGIDVRPPFLLVRLTGAPPLTHSSRLSPASHRRACLRSIDLHRFAPLADGCLPAPSTRRVV